MKKNNKIDSFCFFIEVIVSSTFLFFLKKILIITNIMIIDNIFLKNSSGTSTAIFAPIIDPSIAENANQIDNL